MSIELLNKWRRMDFEDPLLKEELEKKDNVLLPLFKDNIQFGKNGVEAKVGIGTSQLNELTVASVAMAYLKFITNLNIEKKIVIGYDNRTSSKFFAKVFSSVLLANGIETFLYDDSQPASIVSYTIKKMNFGGGVNITASYGPWKNNGIKIYNEFGGLLAFEDTKIIHDYMMKIDPFLVERSNDLPKTIPYEILEEYKEMVEKICLNHGDKKNIKIAYSAQHGTGIKIIPTILKKFGADVHIVDEKSPLDNNFKNSKFLNPAEGKSFKKVERLGRKIKADLFLTTDPATVRLGVAIKYKKRYKYLSGNQVAALFLDYKLSRLKKIGNLPKDGYIITTLTSSSLPSKIANKYGIKTIRTDTGFNNISIAIEKAKGTFVFAFEESLEFLIDNKISNNSDAAQIALGLTDMVSYYNSQGINSFERLKKIYKEFNIHRTTSFTRNITQNGFKTLKKAIEKTRKIGNLKISKIVDHLEIKDADNIIEMIFENGNRIIFKLSENNKKVKVFVESISCKSEKLEDIVWFEKEVNVFVGNNTDDVKEPNFSWKGALKYFLFVGLIIGITIIVFLKIYKDGTTTTGAVASITIAGNIANSINRWIFLSIWIWRAFTITLSAWMKKRMFDIQGVKVKVRHLAISSLMGSVISFVTPFAVGGDAIGYWYMRKKGIKRGSIVATFASSTLISEAKFTLQTGLLLGIGWALYSHIFNSPDPEAKAALIWFIIGTSWMVFATTMIFILTLSKKIQEFLFLTALKLVEWFPYYHLYDPAGLAGTFQYEFRSLRLGMKQIWTKWWFIFEILFYTAIPLLFNPGSLMLMESGWINPNVPSGQYWSQIVANDIVGTANSMSLTPGGTGTAEWLTVQTKGVVYQNSQLANNFGYPSSGKAISSGIDIVWKFFYDWPMLIFSTSLIFIVIFIEKRKKNIDIQNKSNRINDLCERGKTRSILVGNLIMISIILLFFFLLLFVFLK